VLLQKEARDWGLGAGGEDSPESRVQSPEASKTKSQILNPESQREAEACFLKAMAIARQQSAKLFELRATIPLARLWQQQGKRKEAHKMLLDLYGWFTEGFDTPDLKDARTLLEMLA